MSYTFLSALLGLFAASVIFYLVRKNQLYVRYAFWWLLVAAGAAGIGIFPQITDVIAQYFSIGYPPVIALAAAIIFLILKILLMDLERSRQEIRLRRMVQRVALLESVMEERGISVMKGSSSREK